MVVFTDIKELILGKSFLLPVLAADSEIVGGKGAGCGRMCFMCFKYPIMVFK